MNKILLVAVIAIAVVGILTAYIFLAPSFVRKPVVAKPVLTANATVSTEHVNYVANELSTYKLSKGVAGEDPEVEVVVYDKYRGLVQTFAITVKNNVPSASFGQAKNPDIRINTSREVIATLLSSTDFDKDVVELYKQEKIEVKLLKDELTLVTKGYKAIYDQLQQ